MSYLYLIIGQKPVGVVMGKQEWETEKVSFDAESDEDAAARAKGEFSYIVNQKLYRQI